MMFSALILSVLLAVQPVIGVYPTTGGYGGPYQRLEIRTMAATNPKQWSLYIQALQALQDTATTDVGSYYQIMGIHGSPNATWDGVTGDGGGNGYCTHDINIFPTWHRPYIALFEQRLSSIAKSIATKYTSETFAWLNAANSLRAPYYDWVIDPAAGKSAYPDELYLQTLTIQTPTGQKTVNNPLYTYKFPQQVPGFSGPWATWPNTLRYPPSSAQNAPSQPALARSAITSNRPGTKSNVYKFFVQCTEYAWLSNGIARPTNCPTGLEGFHNLYHVLLGGPGSNQDGIPPGHLSVVPFSAFEPMFMLHHTMVDRLFAMWQVAYPNSWVTDTVTNSKTKTIRNGTVQGPNSPLTPFRNSQSQFWTSNMVRSPTALNYTYPELVSANGNVNAMRQIINDLYGPSSTKTAASTSLSARSPATVNLGSIIPQAINGIFYEYSADIVTTRYGLGGTYAVYVFLGNPSSSDPTSWSSDSNLIGTAGIFGSPELQNNDFLSSQTVDLTIPLRQKAGLAGILSSIIPDAVVPYLRDNLTWRVVKEGREVDVRSIYGFKVTVTGSRRFPLSFPGAAEFPRWDSFRTLLEATSGKPGGASA